MKLHGIASDWSGSQHAITLLVCCPGCAAHQCPTAGLHGKSVVSSSLPFSDLVGDEHSPHATDVAPCGFARFGCDPTNRSTSRDKTRLQLVAVCRSDWGRRLHPHAMRSCALDNLHYLSSFVTGAKVLAPCQIGALTTTACLLRSKPLWCVLFIRPHSSPHKTPTVLP